MGRTTKNQRAASGVGSKAETPPTSQQQQQQYETALYSREDIREQYCINKKETDVLDRSSHVRQRAKGFFGCLTSRKVKKNDKLFFKTCREKCQEFLGRFRKFLHDKKSEGRIFLHIMIRCERGQPSWCVCVCPWLSSFFVFALSQRERERISEI